MLESWKVFLSINLFMFYQTTVWFIPYLSQSDPGVCQPGAALISHCIDWTYKVDKRSILKYLMKFKTSSTVSDLETWTRLIYIHNKSSAKFRCNFKPPNSSPIEIHLAYRTIKERSLLKRNLNHWILTKIKFNDRAQRGEKRRSIRIRLRHLECQ